MVDTKYKKREMRRGDGLRRYEAITGATQKSIVHAPSF